MDSVELKKLSAWENEQKSSDVERESRWKPEIDVMYDVDESPPVSLCHV